MLRVGVTSLALIFIFFKLSTFQGSAERVADHGRADDRLRLHHRTHRVMGRRIYALGGNEKAAKLSGVKTERLTFLAFAQHGRAGRGRRAGFRGAAEHGDAQGGLCAGA